MCKHAREAGLAGGEALTLTSSMRPDVHATRPRPAMPSAPRLHGHAGTAPHPEAMD